MMDIPPTGRRMEVDEVYFLRVEIGKFVEFWGLEDNLTRVRHLGLLPPRPMAVARMLAYYAKKLGTRLRQRRQFASKIRGHFCAEWRLFVQEGILVKGPCSIEYGCNATAASTSMHLAQC